MVTSPVRQGRGRRGQSHVDRINQAQNPIAALREATRTLISVVTAASNRDAAAGGAWAWTAIHLLDGLTVLIEHAAKPHPWFADSARWRLNPAGWAPSEAVSQVAARIAGKPPRNGASQ